MDVDWALSQLSEYRALLESHAHTNGPRRAEIGAELDRRLTIVQSIADSIMPSLRGALLASPTNTGYRSVTGPITATNVLIGEVTNREEIGARLAPTAPQLSADKLHPWVWQAAASLWATNHRREAVQAAATLINAQTQTKVARRDLSDSDLMNQVFSKNDPEPGKARLRWPGDPSDIRVQSMNNGLRGYASGIFQTVRNAVTHDLTDIPEQEALEQLSALSLLARWIGQCDVVTA